MDLLRFTPLSFAGRLRLGLATLYAQRVRDWSPLEKMTASEWLTKICGKSVYQTVWEPLLIGKFGNRAKEISAVWFWNKLKIRGSSRGSTGDEQMLYLKGGFFRLLDVVRRRIEELGGVVQVNSRVDSIDPVEGGGWRCRLQNNQIFQADTVLVTLPPPLTAKLFSSWASESYRRKLQDIEYLANTCLVLELKRSLSDVYWLNVGDGNFPFVGLIEHTNLDGAENYGGRHIVYLSKYLSATDRWYKTEKEELISYSLPYLKNIFPDFSSDWIVASHLWREPWAQPIVKCRYSELIPDSVGPMPGLYMHSMAHIYPEDRGSNYAIKAGREMARRIMNEFEVINKATS